MSKKLKLTDGILPIEKCIHPSELRGTKKQVFDILKKDRYVMASKIGLEVGLTRQAIQLILQEFVNHRLALRISKERILEMSKKIKSYKLGEFIKNNEARLHPGNVWVYAFPPDLESEELIRQSGRIKKRQTREATN